MKKVMNSPIFLEISLPLEKHVGCIYFKVAGKCY